MVDIDNLHKNSQAVKKGAAHAKKRQHEKVTNLPEFYY